MLGAVRQGGLATCRLLERVDRTGEYAGDGANSTVSYLRNLSGETNPWASERVQLGRALADRMPATAAAWQSGELGLTHASVIRKAISTLEDDLAAEIEKALAEAAPHITPGQLSDLAAVVRAAAAPEDAEAAAKKNRDNQTLSISKTFDGRYRLDAWFDSEAGAEIAAAIEECTRKRDPNLSVFEDPIGKRRAEALRQMARLAMNRAESFTADGGPRHNLIVAMTWKPCSPGSGRLTSRATDPSPPAPPAASPATTASSRPCSAPSPTFSTWVLPTGSPAHGSGATLAYAMADACSPAVTGRLSAATLTIAGIGSTAARPPNTTSIASAFFTTIGSTKAAGPTPSPTPKR